MFSLKAMTCEPLTLENILCGPLVVASDIVMIRLIQIEKMLFSIYPYIYMCVYIDFLVNFCVCVCVH